MWFYFEFSGPCWHRCQPQRCLSHFHHFHYQCDAPIYYQLKEIIKLEIPEFQWVQGGGLSRLIAMAMTGWIVLIIVNVNRLRLRVNLSEMRLSLSVMRQSTFIVVTFLKDWTVQQTSNVGWLRLIVGVMRWSMFSVVTFMKGWMAG